MEQTLVNGIADNLLHNIFNDLSVGLELYDKDGLMIDVNYSRLRSMGIKDKKDILGYNLFNYTSFSDEIKEQIRKGETVRFMAKYDFDDLCRLFPTNLSGIKFFEITVSFVHNDKSEITNYMVITQDITERVLWQNKYDNLYEEVVRSKKELLESEQRMIHLIRQNELVLNNINSGLAYIANDYIVQWENISLCSKSLSYEAYKKGEPCYLTAHNRTTPCENCVMQRARKSGQVESILFNLDINVPFPMFVFCVFEGLNFERFTARGFDLFFRLFEDRLPPGRISSDTKHSKNTGSIGKRIMPLFPLPPRPIAPAPKEYGHALARRRQSY